MAIIWVGLIWKNLPQEVLSVWLGVMILLFLYLGYMALQAAIEDRRTAARASAILAIVGVVNIPIIHYSVEWWNTLHQPATGRKTPNADPRRVDAQLSRVPSQPAHRALGVLDARVGRHAMPRLDAIVGPGRDHALSGEPFFTHIDATSQLCRQCHDHYAPADNETDNGHFRKKS